MVDLTSIDTEKRNIHTMNLDEFSSLEIARAMNAEDAHVARAIHEILPHIAQAIDWVAEAFEAGGRLVYMGAGTSGRLGVLDAVECPPTFGASPDQVVGLLAGGASAFVKAKEGAEDSFELGEEELHSIDLTSRDIVVGIAASGRTPYVIGGLTYAKACGCKTIAVACSLHSKIGEVADLALEVSPGPEVLTGSTRLKAGTAQKMILNMISTGAFVRIGKAYQNLMVDVQLTNKKLHARGVRILQEATQCSSEKAVAALEEAEGSVKRALVMLLLDITNQEAKEALEKSHGHVRGALASHKG